MMGCCPGGVQTTTLDKMFKQNKWENQHNNHDNLRVEHTFHILNTVAKNDQEGIKPAGPTGPKKSYVAVTIFH